MNKDEYIEQLKYNLRCYIEKCTMYENSNRDFIEDIKELKERISKAIEYIETWAYDEYELARVDEHEPNFTTGEDVITIVETLESILRGDDKE